MSATGKERTDPSQLSVVVIVTGGARGLGRAMTLALLRGGKRVVVADLPESTAEVRELTGIVTQEQSQDRLLAVECNVTRWEQCQNVVNKAIDRFGIVHGLVNNAGVGMQDIGNVLVGKRKPFYEVDTYAWRNAIEVNVNGP